MKHIHITDPLKALAKELFNVAKFIEELERERDETVQHLTHNKNLTYVQRQTLHDKAKNANKAMKLAIKRHDTLKAKIDGINNQTKGQQLPNN